MLQHQLERCTKPEEGGRNSQGVGDTNQTLKAKRRMNVLCARCVLVLHARHQQQLWTSGVAVQWFRAADNKIIRELLIVIPYICCSLLIAGPFAHKRFQLHDCVQLIFSPQTPPEKQVAAAKLPVCFGSLIMPAAAIPQMAGREGQQGQLFNPLHCKHDPFKWRDISQDILVWADLPKQPRTTVALCLSLRDKPLSYDSGMCLPESQV